MQNLKSIKISQITVSKTNTRPEADFKSSQFDDLVSSIREKGVLVPVLVRSTGKDLYELIAGERRLKASIKTGLQEIPANVVVMTDTEAREAQIVENLQRVDIHPLDEAAAYRDLIEKSKPRYDLAEVAAKVGKSESYVRQRLVLTELDPKIAGKVRSGDFPIAHAVLIARLSKEDQGAAFKFATQYQDTCDLSDLRDFISKRVLNEVMKNPPWKDDVQARAEIARVTGIDSGAKNLFGEKVLEKIENPADYARAMGAYLKIKIDEFKLAGKPLTLISGDYSSTTKGVKGRNEYDTGPGHYADKKTKCKSQHDALIVEGEGIGKLIKICTDKKCPAHHYVMKSETPEAKADARAERKKEIETEKKKRQKDNDAMAAAVQRVAYWPIPEKNLDLLLDQVIHSSSHETNMQVCKRRELEVLEKKMSYGGKHKDYSGAIRTAAASMTPADKVGLMLELLLPSYSTHYNDRRKKVLKEVTQ